MAALASTLGFELNGGDALRSVPSGLRPDGFNAETRVLVEAYAHIGKLKGAQLHKVKGDILKLLLLERKLGGSWRKILCFADDMAAEIARGKSWIAEAAREFGIEVRVTPLSVAIAAQVRTAQVRQRMVNPE